MTDHRCPCTVPDRVTCGGCGRAWCERCDPAPSALCHFCHGRGHSPAELEPGEPRTPAHRSFTVVLAWNGEGSDEWVGAWTHNLDLTVPGPDSMDELHVGALALAIKRFTDDAPAGGGVEIRDAVVIETGIPHGPKWQGDGYIAKAYERLRGVHWEFTAKHEGWDLFSMDEAGEERWEIQIDTDIEDPAIGEWKDNANVVRWIASQALLDPDGVYALALEEWARRDPARYQEITNEVLSVGIPVV